jgi:hypothetical protein
MDALYIPKTRWVDGKVQNYWVVWTDEAHYMMIEKGTHTSSVHGTIEDMTDPMPVGNNADMANPWGFIPYVDIHRISLESEFWDTTSGSDLYEFGVCVAYRNTLLDLAATWQSCKQLALEADEKPAQNPTLSPGSVLWGSRNAKWTAVDLQANFDQLRGDLEKYAASVARNYGITLEGYNAPNQSSGIALKVTNQELTDYWEDQQEIFQDAERRLWNLIKIITEKEGLGNWAGIELDLRLASVHVGSSLEDLQLDLAKMDRGMLSPVTVYMKHNENIVNEKEALIKLKENIAMLQDLKPTTMKLGVFDQTDDEVE